MGVFVVRGLGWLRLAQFMLWLWPTVMGIGEYPLLIPASYLVLAASTGGLFYLGGQAKTMTTWLLVADVTIAVVAAIAVSRAYPLGDAASTHNGLIAPLVGTAVTVAVYGSRSGAFLGVALVTAGWVIGTWPDVATPSASVVYSNAIVIVVFAIITWVNGRVLFRAAQKTDTAIDRMLEAEQGEAAAKAREAAAEARDRERRRQYSTLHDTVLHTLEAIARGVSDVHSLQVRQNCERDAEYLRGLITGSIANVPTDLGSALSKTIRNQGSWGSLRINQQFDALPQDVPRDVADAIVGITREALNNVAKYAQVNEVWVTGYGDGQGGVILKVVDQGIGFDPDAEHTGWGLSWSMRDRIRSVGGTIEIDSAPEEGTSVEVSWKP
jgi:signal transduction histidine kinase